MAANNLVPFIPKETNFLAFLDVNQAPEAFQCFVKFLSETYFVGTLTANPILYLDILGDFWNSAVARTVIHEDQSSSLVVNCQIKG